MAPDSLLLARSLLAIVKDTWLDYSAKLMRYPRRIPLLRLMFGIWCTMINNCALRAVSGVIHDPSRNKLGPLLTPLTDGWEVRGGLARKTFAKHSLHMLELPLTGGSTKSWRTSLASLITILNTLYYIRRFDGHAFDIRCRSTAVMMFSDVGWWVR